MKDLQSVVEQAVYAALEQELPKQEKPKRTKTFWTLLGLLPAGTGFVLWALFQFGVDQSLEDNSQIRELEEQVEELRETQDDLRYRIQLLERAVPSDGR
jgi:hypothetical protein